MCHVDRNFSVSVCVFSTQNSKKRKKCHINNRINAAHSGAQQREENVQIQNIDNNKVKKNLLFPLIKT